MVHQLHRLSRLMLGLFMFGFALAFLYRSELGLDPWTVFAEGLALVTGIRIGLIVVILGVVVLLMWIPLRQRPGIGTVANALLVGPFMEVGLVFVETPDSLALRIVFFATGTLMIGIGSGWYIGSGYGPGPRDGLMTGFHNRFGWPIWSVRTGVEVSVVVTGWLLGGTVGWGTVAFAVAIGPLVQPSLKALAMPDYWANSTGK
jgi:uncharacterized membrane protein YczE